MTGFWNKNSINPHPSTVNQNEYNTVKNVVANEFTTTLAMNLLIFNSFMTGVHIIKKQVYQWAGFCIIGPSVMKELINLRNKAHWWNILVLSKVKTKESSSRDHPVGLRPATLLKKRLWRRCFPVNFAKFLRTSIFIEHLWWLLLHIS